MIELAPTVFVHDLVSANLLLFRALATALEVASYVATSTVLLVCSYSNCELKKKTKNRFNPKLRDTSKTINLTLFSFCQQITMSKSILFKYSKKISRWNRQSRSRRPNFMSEIIIRNLNKNPTMKKPVFFFNKVWFFLSKKFSTLLELRFVRSFWKYLHANLLNWFFSF